MGGLELYQALKLQLIVSFLDFKFLKGLVVFASMNFKLLVLWVESDRQLLEIILVGFFHEFSGKFCFKLFEFHFLSSESLLESLMGALELSVQNSQLLVLGFEVFVGNVLAQYAGES